ncbi:MAG: hypothetical protein KAH26_08710 [Bacteroidales bacterium]|nr:hypothetical protein [Bacteroidales bacterium]
MKFKPSVVVLIMATIILAGCATYYQKMLRFQTYIMEGEIEKAQQWLSKNDKDKEGKNKLLYHMYRGWVSWMMGDYNSSNEDLETADLLIEDFRKQIGYEAFALISNPGVKPYQAEDFEKVMVNYFKALNYIQLGNYEGAIVEARRITIKLQKLNSKYKDHKNRYSDDAFAHVIIGMLYDADGDYNNAFIAYRNALEAYENIYLDNFGLAAPLQLKKDILRTAYLTGFHDEVDHYEQKFGIKYEKDDPDNGDLVFIWQNGFGPVKSEWSITFTMVPGDVGFVTYTNEEYGLTFPFYIGDRSPGEQAQLRDLSILRIAFPKYVERVPVFNEASLDLDSRTVPLELVENINNIAFKTLHDRMLREFANALLRVATKRALEIAVREATKEQSKENKLDAGDIAPAAITILNAITEKADTRNWQTLPHSIYYTRVKLPEGDHDIRLNTSNGQQTQAHTITLNIRKKKTTFYVFQSLESHLPEQ